MRSSFRQVSTNQILLITSLISCELKQIIFINIKNMSAHINIYTNSLTDNLIPEIVERLNQHEKVLSLEQSFTFKNPRSILSLAFRWTKPSIEILNTSVLKVQFSTSFKPFELSEFKKKNVRQKVVKQSFIDKLLRKKKKKVYKPIKISAEVEAQLKGFKKVFSIKYYPGNLFEHHLATLLGSIVTEMGQGICHFTNEDIWYTDKNAVAECMANLYSLEDLSTLAEEKVIPVAPVKIGV